MGDFPLEIDVATLAEKRRDAGHPGDFQLLDVREAWEREICALDGSLHIPMGDIPDRVTELDPNRPVFVLCHHGGRSLNVTRWLRSKGFNQATNVAGGIHEWANRIDPAVPQY